MRFSARVWVLAVGMLLAPAVQAEEDWTLNSAKAAFTHTQVAENSVSVLSDGWEITFLADDGLEIGAVIIMAQDHAAHAYNLSDTVERLAELVNMDEPEVMEFEGRREMALLLDRTVIQRLAGETDHVFARSPLAGFAYLLEDGYFYVHDMRNNGYVHWKTARKSGVNLLMPMMGKELQAIEITGYQEMHEYASAVLADKLGLPANTASESIRQAHCGMLHCSSIPYMNIRSGVLLANTEKRSAIGKRALVVQMLHNRHYAEILCPDQASPWPEKKPPQPVAQEPQQEIAPKEQETPPPPAEPKPLDPAAAREAYLKYLREL